MESEEVAQPAEDLYRANEIEEEDQEEEETPLRARELLQQSAARMLGRRVYYDDPPPEITEEHAAQINDIPCTQEAVDVLSIVDENIQLAELRDKAARRIEKLRYLEEANRAKRCEHIKADGENCSGPALRGEQYCRFHLQSYIEMGEFPVIEDRRSLQLAFSQLVRETTSGRIAPAQARVLMQILDKAGRYLPKEKEARVAFPSMP